MKYTKERIAEAKARLEKFVKPGDTIYCVVRSVSRSGMSREIDLYAIKDNEPIYLSSSAAVLLGWPISKRDAIKVSGCGMDMCFHTVYSLSYAMFDNGYELGRHTI